MTPLLEVDGIGITFGALKAVSDLRFQVGQGEIVGLIGPNGAGKTTAINLLSGTLRPSTGKVRFQGETVMGMRTHHLVQRGLVRTFQSTNVYGERTIAENIRRGAFLAMHGGFWPAMLNTRSERGRRAAVEARVAELQEKFGLSAVADTVARNMPYGRQKMLGLATALAAQPRLLLLDEPAAGLSSEEADRIAEMILAINRGGVSIVVVDHNMRFIARLCHRVVVMHHGMELCVGTPAEVVANPEVIEAYLGTSHEPA
jgi:branched-chain amino acid transport system ATP-binding protein